MALSLRRNLHVMPPGLHRARTLAWCTASKRDQAKDSVIVNIQASGYRVRTGAIALWRTRSGMARPPGPAPVSVVETASGSVR